MADLGTIIAYNMPIVRDDSYHIACENVFIEKAILSVNGVVLSIFRPNYKGVDINTDIPLYTELAFFGETPIHGGLMSQLKVTCALYVYDRGVMPKLIIKPHAGTCLRWDDIKCAIYEETVQTFSCVGPVIKHLIYTPTHVGFKRMGK